MFKLPSTLLLSLVTFGLFAFSAQEERPWGGITTLYAQDDVASSFSFFSGGPGARVFDGELQLRDAQLVYHGFGDAQLAYGFVHDELVAVLDLGDLDVQPIPSATDDALSLPVSLYQTLFLDGPNFAYVNAAGKAVRLKEADPILDPLPASGLTLFEPQLGHTYLIRATSRRNRSYDVIAKFQIIDVRPGESLTLRWERLRG